MNPPPFQPKSRLEPAFTCDIQSGRFERHLEVFWWEDRLVAHEEESGLWWGTLDAWDGRNAREFWDECVGNGRVGRLFSHRQGYQKKGTNGSMLLMREGPFHVLVAQDNSGIVRIENGSKWYPFSAVEPLGVRKPLAHRPTIWSRLFLTKFALRALPALDLMAEELLPEPMRVLWLQGDEALPMRLIKAALSLGWADELADKRMGFWMEPARFWREVLERRYRLSLNEEGGAFALPEGMLQCPEATLPGSLSWAAASYNGQYNQTPVFRWRGGGMEVHVRLRLTILSTQKLAALRLELRDWLAQFFLSSEVEAWFDS